MAEGLCLEAENAQLMDSPTDPELDAAETGTYYELQASLGCGKNDSWRGLATR